jgi:uncharacterized protein YndB with AHSA1/START domain
MNEHNTAHSTFVIERSLKASPEKVFKAFSTIEGKSGWFAGPPMWKELERKFDFRVGGHETLKNEMDTGVVTSYAAEFLDIIPNERIIYSYEMHMDDKKISISLATIEFTAEEDGTKLVVTEQGAYLDDFKDADSGDGNTLSREHGTGYLLDGLKAYVEKD